MHFRNIRQSALLAYSDDLIDDEEFALIYDSFLSKNPDLTYYRDNINFDLDNFSDDECKTLFRFQKNDIYDLVDVFNVPDPVVCYNRVNVPQVEALCVLLKRLAYPCRYSDMLPIFGRNVPQLSIVTNTLLNYLFERWGSLLSDFNQPWLNSHSLQSYARAVSDKGAALDNCWGFVDGTVRPCCRPNQDQRLLYNGHKRVHAIKFQSVVAPNGLIANLYGPVEGCRHDSGMLAMSGLYPQLQQHAMDPQGNILCIYGDPAYPLRPQLMCPFQGAFLSPDETVFNSSMSQVRVAVEWVFNDISNYFKFIDFKKNLKVGLSPVGKTYLVCGLLHNARTMLYGNVTSKYFDIDPPDIYSYFV